MGFLIYGGGGGGAYSEDFVFIHCDVDRILLPHPGPFRVKFYFKHNLLCNRVVGTNQFRTPQLVGQVGYPGCCKVQLDLCYLATKKASCL